MFVPHSKLRTVLIAHFPSKPALRARLVKYDEIEKALMSMFEDETAARMAAQTGCQQVSHPLSCTLQSLHFADYAEDVKEEALQAVLFTCFGQNRCNGKTHLSCLIATQLQ